MRTITKLMLARTIFDTNAPRLTNLYMVVKEIIHLEGARVVLHPADARRVMHALRFFIKDVDLNHLNEVFIRSNL
jgi:hypothetical protein